MECEMSKYIHGFHLGSWSDHIGDPWTSTGAHLMTDRPGVLVFTEIVGDGHDYRVWSDAGYTVLVRLNHAYGTGGTIPLIAQYAEFAQRCAVMIAASRGVDGWIIGNEVNFRGEWPDGVPIRAEDYAACFELCKDAIQVTTPDAQVLIAGIAPYNADSGDWVEYLEDVIDYLAQMHDGIALHSYSHGQHPELIASEKMMDPPYQDRHFEFRAYRDFMSVIPDGVPVWITESNPGADPDHKEWRDINSGWVQGAHAEINNWNRAHPARQIRGLCLYRYPKIDPWWIQGNAGVEADFAAAVAMGYEWTEEEPMPDWTATYTNHCDDYHEWGEHPPITVLDGWAIDWDRSKPRPEMTFKYDPQQEVYKLDPPRSGVGFHVSTAFDWWMRTEQPINIAAGVRTKLAVALMVVAHGIGGDDSKLGDCGMQIGIGGPNEDDLSSPNIVWSEWYTVRVGEGGNLEEYAWVIAETPEIIPQVGRASLWIRCVANVAADISAGHFDLIQVLQMTDDPVPPPAGTWRTVTYDPAGNAVGEITFEGPSVNPQICSHAQAIIELACA